MVICVVSCETAAWTSMGKAQCEHTGICMGMFVEHTIYNIVKTALSNRSFHSSIPRMPSWRTWNNVPFVVAHEGGRSGGASAGPPPHPHAATGCAGRVQPSDDRGSHAALQCRRHQCGLSQGECVVCMMVIYFRRQAFLAGDDVGEDGVHTPSILKDTGVFYVSTITLTWTF